MLAFSVYLIKLVKGERIMVNVRKRGKVYEYRFEVATVEGTRKWITKSGFPTKSEAFKEGAIYGSIDSGEYVNWRQSGQSWSNIKIGNTNSTLAQIGCLVTSISILIEKSDCNSTITPFNPGTFLEE